MTRPLANGETLVVGVVGRPITHSLSPLIHNAWIAAAGLNAAYVPFSPPTDRVLAFFDGLRGGVVRGLNVTTPFKEKALLIADQASPAASGAGAANLLLFEADGRILADNTDGDGLIYALTHQAPRLVIDQGPVVILGAGGAARGAAATLRAKGVADLRVVNRTLAKAKALAEDFPGVRAYAWADLAAAACDAGLIINATAAELDPRAAIVMDFSTLAPRAVAMDMLYRPLKTRFLQSAESAGLHGVDGLDMLIGQAVPTFERFFGQPPPAAVDARALALAHLEPR